MKPVRVALWDDLQDRKPAGALVANVDLVIVRYEDKVSVLYGRCLHRGALLEDGHVDGDNLICGVHNGIFGSIQASVNMTIKRRFINLPLGLKTAMSMSMKPKSRPGRKIIPNPIIATNIWDSLLIRLTASLKKLIQGLSSLMRAMVCLKRGITA